MIRVIKVMGRVMEIPKYREKYRYENQEIYVDCIPINPLLRPFFYDTPHNLREALELKDWWDKPYIETISWNENFESYPDYTNRVSILSDFNPKNKNDFLAETKQLKKQWFEIYPWGIRFDVRCLNGIPPDRPSCLAMVGTIELALQVVKIANKNKIL